MITEDTLIRRKFHSGFKRNVPITELVLHGSYTDDDYSYILNGEKTDLYKRGIDLPHYLIVNDSIKNLIDPNKWTYHSNSGFHDEETIAITIQKLKTDYPTDNQYANINYLIKTLLMLYPTIKHITTHEINAKKYSNMNIVCLGGYFDFGRIKQLY